MEFLKSNISAEWWDLVNEFPEFTLELSPYVEEWYDKYHDFCPEVSMKIEDLTNLRYGFECGIGWKEIIREYFIEMRKLLARAKDNGHDVHYKTCIFKEKFGELRDQGDFYGDDRKLYYDDYHKLDNILRKSTKTCEKCGDVGILRTENWYKTLCDDHYKSWKNR
jgi:hypothetical protein